MRKPLIILVLAAILLTAIASFFLVGDSGREFASDVVDEGSADDPEVVGRDDAAQGSEDDVREKRLVHSSADRLTRSAPGPEVELFETAAKASDFLSEASRLHQWNEEVITENVKLWSRPCEHATKFEPYKDVPPQKLREMDAGVAALVDFWAYCQDLIDPDTGKVSDSLMSEMYEFAAGDELSPDQHWTGLNDVFSARDLDLAGDIVISQLNQALHNLDEASVKGSILQLLRPGAEIIAAPEIVDGRRPHTIYTPVVGAVAATLLCQHVGGCYGPDHPMVLRACMLANERTVGCLEPVDLMDAHYQTQTPVEHMLFWSLLNQINDMLIAYRR